MQIVCMNMQKLNSKVVKMTRKKMKINWICKIFGHSFDLIDLTIFKVKNVAINRKKLNPKINCRRCGKLFKYNSQLK